MWYESWLIIGMLINDQSKRNAQHCASVERLRWCEAFLWGVEHICSLLLCLVPKRLLVCVSRRLLASQVYRCSPRQIFLFKSGRSALRALLASFKRDNSERGIALIPDYTCNVVAKACQAAGYKVQAYRTDDCFFPDWKEVVQRIENVEFPVLIVCSLFGSTPGADDHLQLISKENPDLLVVLDECQNLVHNPVEFNKWAPNGGVVFSFNDKTCPGSMGGGLVMPHGVKVPVIETAIFHLRLRCTMGIAYMTAKKCARDLWHIITLMARVHRPYRPQAGFEYSVCQSAHYDLRPELIYKQSVARSIVSLIGLRRYSRRRSETIADLSSYLRSSEAQPCANCFENLNSPFVVIRDDVIDTFSSGTPFPVKVPYADIVSPNICSRPVFLAKVNIPYVGYQ